MQGEASRANRTYEAGSITAVRITSSNKLDVCCEIYFTHYCYSLGTCCNKLLVSLTGSALVRQVLYVKQGALLLREPPPLIRHGNLENGKPVTIFRYAV